MASTNTQSSKSALRTQFCNVTLALPEVATTFLEKHKWNVQLAVRAFYNEQGPLPAAAPSKALVQIFDKYKDPESPETIQVDGTLAYLEDLGFDPEHLISLTLAYVLKSPQMGEFTRLSFLEMWTQLNISTIAAMREYILERHHSVQTSPQEFERLYQYVFDFVRGSDTRIKAIGYEDATLYWRMLLSENEDLAECKDRLDQWYTFIEENKINISKDAWNMFYKFVQQVMWADPQHLSGYDEMGAWPSTVDEYMEWLLESGLLHQD